MENKTNTIVAIGGILIAASSFGFSWFTRNQDKSSEFMEKEAQYRRETQSSIQSIKEQHEKELQAHKNKFQEHLLDNQKELYEIRQELSLVSQHILSTKNQYEYLDSKYKLADEEMRTEIIKEIRK